MNLEVAQNLLSEEGSPEPLYIPRVY
jgi:tetratricopeptide (TPR) repeat protein